MKLKNKLIPLVAVAGLTATIVPITTSCGGKSTSSSTDFELVTDGESEQSYMGMTTKLLKNTEYHAHAKICNLGETEKYASWFFELDYLGKDELPQQNSWDWMSTKFEVVEIKINDKVIPEDTNKPVSQSDIQQGHWAWMEEGSSDNSGVENLIQVCPGDPAIQVGVGDEFSITFKVDRDFDNCRFAWSLEKGSS